MEAKTEKDDTLEMSDVSGTNKKEEHKKSEAAKKQFNGLIIFDDEHNNHFSFNRFEM
jgi:hypothetical protein